MPDVTNPADRKEERVGPRLLRVTRRSTFTQVVHTQDLNITQEEWDRYVKNPGGLIQDMFPMLNAEQREFLLTGTTQVEWDAVFPPEEEEMA